VVVRIDKYCYYFQPPNDLKCFVIGAYRQKTIIYQSEFFIAAMPIGTAVVP
jgi:hypothetical protein